MNYIPGIQAVRYRRYQTASFYAKTAPGADWSEEAAICEPYAEYYMRVTARILEEMKRLIGDGLAPMDAYLAVRPTDIFIRQELENVWGLTGVFEITQDDDDFPF